MMGLGLLMSEITQESTGTSLPELIQERAKLLALMTQLDDQIQYKIQQALSSGYQPLSVDSIGRIIESKMGELTISELVDFAGVSTQTYYNVRDRLEVVSVGKLNSLLGAIGLQLFVGKRQSTKL